MLISPATGPPYRSCLGDDAFDGFAACRAQSLNLYKDALDVLGRARRQTWMLSELITATSVNAAMHKKDKQICRDLDFVSYLSR